MDREVPIAVYEDENGRGALKVTGSFTTDAGPYDPPPNTTRTTDNRVGNVQTVQHFNGLTLLKTITITYTGCNKEAVVTTP